MLAYWKKSDDKLTQCIKKQKNYFANKVHIVKVMIFPVVMYGYESWTMSTEELMLSNCDAGEDS